MTMRGFGRNQAMDLLKASIACALGAALVGCESTSSHFVAHKPLVELASTQGDVRELEMRAGFLHLEATCRQAFTTVKPSETAHRASGATFGWPSASLEKLKTPRSRHKPA